MSFQDKVRRRAAAGRDEKPTTATPAANEQWVAASLLDATRADAARAREHARKLIRTQRDTIDALQQALRDLLRMTAPATVPHYQGGHAGHVAAVRRRVREVLVATGAITEAGE